MGNSLPSSLDLGGRVVKIKCQIAEGGCGYVYKGEDELGKEYALKIVRVARERGGGPVVDEEAAEMASLEQTVVKRLCPHPNIVEAFDCGTTWEDSEVRYHILSEFCPRSVLGMLSDARRGPAGHLPERDIMWILRDTLMALLHMHSQSPPIAHRDLKVENLLIGADGRCKLCDFGSCSVTHRAFAGARDAALAKEEIRRRTTPAYRAPEQVDLHLGHVVSERVDVWALGVLLFKLAFGATPFEDARGDVQNLGILGGFRAERAVPAAAAHAYSEGLIALMAQCMTLDPAARPGAAQLLRACDVMRAAGALPYWPSVDDLPSSGGSAIKSNGSAAALPRGAAPQPSSEPAAAAAAPVSPERPAAAAAAATTPAAAEAATAESIPPPTYHHSSSVGLSRTTGSLMGGSGGVALSASTGGAGHRRGGSASAATSSSRAAPAPLVVTGQPWMEWIGEGVRSKLYKMMGGEQQKRLWVLKATSRAPCGPKPKYVRKIVLALWDGGFTIGGYFELLRFRPLAESPVVAAKALITLLKALQQGPAACLMECCSYADMVQEIGEMWAGAAEGGGGGVMGTVGPGGEYGSDHAVANDAAFSVLIVRFSTALVQKVRFNQHHPEYGALFGTTVSDRDSAFAAAAADGSGGNGGGGGSERAQSVVRRLLSLQACVLGVLRQAFLVLAASPIEAQIVTRAALLPLVDEAFATYTAARRLLLSFGPPPRAPASPGAAPALFELASEFEAQAAALRQFCARADEVEEVRVMGRTPAISAVSLFDQQQQQPAAAADAAGGRSGGRAGRGFGGGGGGARSGHQQQFSTEPAVAGRASSKLEALRTLRHEEKVLQRFASTVAGGGAVAGSLDASSGSAQEDLNDDDSEGDADEMRELEADPHGTHSGGDGVPVWAQLPRTPHEHPTPTSFRSPAGYAVSPPASKAVDDEPLISTSDGSARSGGGGGAARSSSAPPPQEQQAAQAAPRSKHKAVADLLGDYDSEPPPQVPPMPSPLQQQAPPALPPQTPSQHQQAPSQPQQQQQQQQQHGGLSASGRLRAADGAPPPPLPPRRPSVDNNAAGGGGGGSSSSGSATNTPPPPLPPRNEGRAQSFLASQQAAQHQQQQQQQAVAAPPPLFLPMPVLPMPPPVVAAASGMAPAANAAAAAPAVSIAAMRQAAKDEDRLIRERKHQQLQAQLLAQQQRLLQQQQQQQAAAAATAAAAAQQQAAVAAAAAAAQQPPTVAVLQQAAAAAAAGQALRAQPVPLALPVQSPQARTPQLTPQGAAAAAGGGGATPAPPLAAPPPPQQAWPQQQRYAQAKFEFTAKSPEQLSFKAGEFIRLRRDTINSKGWGLGEIRGKMGWFPGDFVRIIPPGQVPPGLDGTATVGRGREPQQQHAGAAQQQQQQQMPPVDNLVGSAQQGGAEYARDEAVQPEHQFAMQMARAQPWKERLTPGGKQAYMDLVSFFSASGLMMSFDDLQLRAVIGSGAFATVFRAIYRKRDVAVKKLMGGGGGPMEKTLRDFKTEAALLSRLRHRNIIAPIGATADPVTIVMEYCSRGNLMMLLNDTAIDLPWPRRLRMCVDVAAGMRYLHTQNPVIIHRDLKSLNVLVDDNWVSKVTDFGLSRFKATSESEKMTGQAGTYHWMSPEVINSQHYTEKADVFSFGIIMWEVYTRSIPYDGMQPVQVVAAVLGRRERPRIPATCPPILAALIQQCWSHDPAVRPAFDEIHARLEAMPS